MRQKTVLLLLSLVLTTIFFLQPEASMQSGDLSYPQLTKEEIAGILIDDFVPLPKDIFQTDPHLSAPYATGTVNRTALEAATARFNAIRRLSGLPPVVLDMTLSEKAQYGAVLLNASDYAHLPKKPTDMTSEFYTQGRAATSSSNLYIGKNLITAVDGFMHDSDTYNLPNLGHRRWQQSPFMGRIGFGYVPAANGRKSFVVEKISDMSGEPFDYDLITWPSSGNFPNEMFNGPAAWSIILNSKKYKTPDISAVKVTLTRQSDNKVWEFSGKYDVSVSGDYFRANTVTGLPGPCIIFRPGNTNKYEGIWTVSVAGVTDKQGNPVDISYTVDFFSMSDIEESPYSDVSRSNPLYGAVKGAYSDGVLPGVSQGTRTAYEPDTALSGAFWGYIMGSSFYKGELYPSTTGDISGRWLSLAEEHGLLNEISDIDKISRGDMAHCLIRILMDLELYTPSDNAATDLSECVRLGLLNNGPEDTTLTRGDAAAVYMGLRTLAESKGELPWLMA